MEKARLHWAGFFDKRLGCWFGLVWAATERRPLPVPGHLPAISLSLAARRDLLREALFLWRMPFWTALSSVLDAARTALSAASTSSPAMARFAPLTAVRVARRRLWFLW